MATQEERLDAITQSLELVAQMQVRTERIVNLLAEDQVKTARIMQNLAILVHDHENRLKAIEGP